MDEIKKNVLTFVKGNLIGWNKTNILTFVKCNMIGWSKTNKLKGNLIGWNKTIIENKETKWKTGKIYFKKLVQLSGKIVYFRN